MELKKRKEKKEKSFSLKREKKRKERKKVPDRKGLAEKERKKERARTKKLGNRSHERPRSFNLPGWVTRHHANLSCPRRAIESRKEERDPAGRDRERRRARRGIRVEFSRRR